MNRIEAALAAYMEILHAPRGSESGFTPPPSSGMRDKLWTRQLRGFWPDYQSVSIADNVNSDKRYEMTKWCKETVVQLYWYSANRDVFVFSDKQDATMFKLKWS